YELHFFNGIPLKVAFFSGLKKQVGCINENNNKAAVFCEDSYFAGVITAFCMNSNTLHLKYDFVLPKKSEK
ncbi:MAG TPA: hypothetical protein VFC68_03940, partial [Treponemataceae bacterium]|nr:hypothetical protein [Treponemataceae bacterium]